MFTKKALIFDKSDKKGLLCFAGCMEKGRKVKKVLFSYYPHSICFYDILLSVNERRGFRYSDVKLK